MVQVHPSREDSKLHIPGNDGGKSRALHAHFRRTEVAENQNVVEAQVHHHSGDARQPAKKGDAPLIPPAPVPVATREAQHAPAFSVLA